MMHYLFKLFLFCFVLYQSFHYLDIFHIQTVLTIINNHKSIPFSECKIFA